MDHLKLALWTFDVGSPTEDAAAFADSVTSRVIESWDSGADIVAFPEFMWMGLERFIAGTDKTRGVSELFWNDLWPGIAAKLDRPDKAVVLGTVPFVEHDGRLRNRAPILTGGRFLHQDKIHLTPWEESFSGGGPVLIWNFRGLRVAVVICLDVEIAEISVALRGMNLDLMLVPSATESLLGVERVGRCADARAVELGCHVGLCHLVGRMESALIDENLGRLAVFSPSQAAFQSIMRQTASQVFTAGFHCMSSELDFAAIRENRAQRGETDPSKVVIAAIQVEEAAATGLHGRTGNGNLAP
jgi:predicted amidohydrolase